MVISRIAILDAGSQFTKLIDKKVLGKNIKTEIVPLETFDVSTCVNYNGIIISGGPGSVSDEAKSLYYNPLIFNSGIPILGICYGMQMMVRHFGGMVTKPDYSSSQDGQIKIRIERSLETGQISKLFDRGIVSDEANVLLTHFDICKDVSFPLVVDARTLGGIVCSVSHKEKPIYGVQFHPEVDLTEIGDLIFDNFLFGICKCSPNFTLSTRIDETVCEIQSFVKNFRDNYHVIVLVSGGVDSIVCCSLLTKAIDPKRLHIIHIDHGFMRENESNNVIEKLKMLGIQAQVFNEQSTFLHACTQVEFRYENSIENQNQEDFFIRGQEVEKDEFLTEPIMYKMKDSSYKCSVKKEIGPLCNVVDPESKRKIIGNTFMVVVERIMRKMNLPPENTIIAQGTLRPDLIESASNIVSKHADVIKTHHNDTEFVRQLRNKPLKDFHKDEVRKIGRALGLPEYFINRHPFPGPGLAIRIICNKRTAGGKKHLQKNTKEEENRFLTFVVNYHLLKEDTYYKAEHEKLKKKLNMCELRELDCVTSKQGPLFSQRMPVNCGDCRTYKNPVVLSCDTNPHWPSLMGLAKFVTKLFNFTNRVVYTLGSAIDFNISEKQTLSLICPNTLNILRKCDLIVNEMLTDFTCMDRVSQMPVILIPIDFDVDAQDGNHGSKYSIVLRPFISNDFMTGLPATPGIELPTVMIDKIKVRILNEVPQISRVLYDITGKPPGTTEWE